MKQVIKEEGAVPVKIWTKDVEPEALSHLKNLSRLPFVSKNGIAVMPDCKGIDLLVENTTKENK